MKRFGLDAFNVSATTFVILVTLILISPFMLKIVGSGELGVLYSIFTGTSVEQPYQEGLHVIFPADTMYIYDARIQALTRTVKVLSFNGLAVEVTLTCRFNIIQKEVGLLHYEVGPDYIAKIIEPVLMASAREVIGNYKPEELYTTHSTTIQDEIDRVAQESIKPFHIVLLPVLVESLKLPDEVNTAIEEKLRLQQEAQAYEFRIARETQEVARMRLEGEGKLEYNRLLSETLSPELLQYLGIEAMQNLATSENAKVVVLPTGDSHGIQIQLPMDTSTSKSSYHSEPSAEDTKDPVTEIPATKPKPPAPHKPTDTRRKGSK